MRSIRNLPAWFLLVPLAWSAELPARISLYPSGIHLRGSKAQQALLVTAVYPDGRERDVTSAVTFSQNPLFAVTAAGVLVPKAEGQARLTALYEGKKASAEVSVQALNASQPVSFVRDVSPILTERGCTGSNCHGSVRGKGDFKLSLFGGRPDVDYEAIVKGSGGRRVDLTDPAKSLLLRKPSFQTPHGGGVRFKVDSAAYQTIREWIAAGIPYDSGGPDLTDVKAYPAERVLAGADATQRLVISGTYSDGSVADVTRHVRYSSNDESVASVDEAGIVTARRPGETAIMIRTQGKTAVARVAVITGRALPAGFAYPAPRNFIDEQVIAKWRKLNIEPSAPAGDEVFLRRAFLDTIGVLPTRAEAREFLASTDPEKRAKLIDSLLGRPEFVDLWAMKFADLYQLAWSGVKGGWQLHRWIRKSLEQHKPYDQMVRQMILGSGSFVYDPTANFYSGLFTGPEGMVTQVSQSLLGVRMDCAKCHDHPWENWTQNDFYGIAAFFSRLSRKAEPYGLFEHSVVLRPNGKPTYDYVNNNKELLHPKTKTPVKPRYLGGQEVESREGEDVREKLATWLTSPRNPWFTRAIVNRIWRHYLGRGVVEPVDDFRVSNPPSNPALLDALAGHLARERYDLRALMRAILNSQTYQLSSAPLPGNQADTMNYARYYPKRQMAEVLFDTMGQATEARQKIPGAPPGDRAMAVAVGSPNYFLTAFGKVGQRDQICERNHEPDVAQAMHLINGDLMQNLTTARNNIVDRVLANEMWDDRRRLSEIYQAALTRTPTAPELEASQTLLSESANAETRKKVYQDILWAILNSKEFAHIY
ncbi:MAG: DUF1553 domain-containing protein [Bryobacteraceae bacterium]